MKFTSNSSAPAANGFTLIELLGTLAILSILTWMATEGLFGRLKDTLRQDEAGRLVGLAEALRQGVIQQHAVPAETNWAPFLALQLGQPVLEVGRNSAGWNRRLIFDPNFRLGTPATPPPFVQTAGGSPTVTHARAVFLSTLAADFPNLTSVQFDDLWDCPPSRLPQHWSTRWAGKPADLLIERVSFVSLFRRVCLNNHDLDSAARYAIDSTNWASTIPAGGRMDSTYLVTSQLLLLGEDGTIQLSEPIAGESSFAFEAGTWRGGLASGLANASSALADAFDRFARLPDAGQPAGPAVVALAMHELLGEYNRWARDGFITTSTLAGEPPPSFRRVQEATARLGDFAGLLLGENPNLIP